MKRIQATIIFSLFTYFYVFTQTSNMLDKQLFEALENNDTSQIIQLINSGANVNARTGWDVTPLQKALFSKSDIKIIELLIKSGADINDNSWLQGTPLHTAVCNKNVEAIKLFIENGADVNAEDSLGNTPIMLTKDRAVKQLLRYYGASGKYGKRVTGKLRDVLFENRLLGALNLTDNKLGFETGIALYEHREVNDIGVDPFGSIIELSAGIYPFGESSFVQPQVTYYAFFFLIQGGASLNYCTDFTNGNLNLRPFLGLTFVSMIDISYGYNFALTNHTFPEINTHTFQLKIRF
jgi:hypothetical protein